MKKEKKTPALLVGHGIPDYQEITPKDINIFIPKLLDDLNIDLNNLEDDLKRKLDNNINLNWEDLFTPIHKIGERLRWSWGVISHLNGVCNSSDLREAYSKQQPEIIKFTSKFGQSKVIFNCLMNIKTNRINNLNETQIRILDAEILSMKNSGVGLEGNNKDIFNKNSQRLAELSNDFSNNVLDSTNQWSMLLTKPSEIEGLPKRVLDNFEKAAKEDKNFKDLFSNSKEDSSGPWKVGLDMPSYISFLTYSKCRNLREKIYKAQVSRASVGELNNKNIIEEILILRKNQANLLGYENWADLSLASKMAKDKKEVETLLEELRSAAFKVAKKEMIEMQECARNEVESNSINLQPWDTSFWSEKLKQSKFDLDQESLRPYFPLPKVLEGLFNLCERLFDIKISKVKDAEFPKWHKDVSMFLVKNKDDSKIAYFYLDPYTRAASKRGGAWMDDCLTREINDKGEKVLPVAYLICNQTPPSGDTPSLMSFEEVSTLFHEFGHGLQHMLTEVDYPQAAGINNVEWDAVELPSQFMENWCLDRKTLMSIAKHWETGEQLPESEYQKLKMSKTFNSGLSTLRQIHFALTDLKLHSEWNQNSEISPDQLRRLIAENTTIIKPIKEDNFLCAFSHIFAGGYSAGYYSYKWAEVLSSDAFAAFEEAGLDNEDSVKKIGKLFRKTVLSLGGSRAPSDVYAAFRGRAPSTKALIRHSGLNS
tara:strand:+ start:258 stop:2384 length:2127 start_codon:yes stop_codon:yes gene_type:complete